jgi:hypothetical protein
MVSRAGEVLLEEVRRLELPAERVNCRAANCPAHTVTCTRLTQASLQDHLCAKVFASVRGGGGGDNLTAFVISPHGLPDPDPQILIVIQSPKLQTLKKPRNRFPARRNRFLGSLNWGGGGPGNTWSVLSIRIHWIRIRIQHFKWIRIQGFDDQILRKIIQPKKMYLFNQKLSWPP